MLGLLSSMIAASTETGTGGRRVNYSQPGRCAPLSLGKRWDAFRGDTQAIEKKQNNIVIYCKDNKNVGII